MDKKIRRLMVYLHDIAFNLIPQQFFLHKSKIISESQGKETCFEMSNSSSLPRVPTIKSCSSSLTP